MLSETISSIIVVVVVSYLLGSIPTAYIVAQKNRVNIFEVGSGNMGATNVMRAMGFWWGILVWMLDSLKGIAAILFSYALLSGSQPAGAAIAATAAVVGHNWSVFATALTGSIRGGKGAACAFGTMLVLAPFQVIVVMTVLGASIVALTRYVSLAVLAMFALATVWILVLVGQDKLPLEYTFYSLVIAVLLVWRFRENIQRLLTGTERRLGEHV